jgi:hypothetical protein
MSRHRQGLRLGNKLVEECRIVMNEFLNFGRIVSRENGVHLVQDASWTHLSLPPYDRHRHGDHYDSR